MADTAMAALQYDLSKLTDPRQPGKVHLTAVRAVLEKSLLSSLVVLPTQGVEDTFELFERFAGDLDRTSTQLTEFIDSIDSIDSGDGSGRARSEALLAKNFIDVFREVLDNIGAEAAEIGEDEIARIIDERDSQPVLRARASPPGARCVAPRGRRFAPVSPCGDFSVSGSCQQRTD